MSSVADVVKLKKKVDQLKVSVERARGEAESIRRALRKDWQCTNLAEAREKLKSLTVERERRQGQFDRRLAAFQEKWADELQSVG